jgi:hypothetical protein
MDVALELAQNAKMAVPLGPRRSAHEGHEPGKMKALLR